MLDWLLRRIADEDGVSGDPPVSAECGDVIGIGVEGRFSRIAIALAADSEDVVTIAPNIRLVPTDSAILEHFLRSHWRSLDHIGINISARDLDIAGWRRLIADIAQSLPAYRLNVDSPNDIVMIVDDGTVSGSGVVELVHDRTASYSSFHLCISVHADRAALEAMFPPPLGAYKPGDEPFFRSVALPGALRLPAYLDLAFSDGGMTPWADIVGAMGTRIG